MSQDPPRNNRLQGHEATGRLVNGLPAEWIPSEVPESGEPSMFEYYKTLDGEYTRG